MIQRLFLLFIFIVTSNSSASLIEKTVPSGPIPQGKIIQEIKRLNRGVKNKILSLPEGLALKASDISFSSDPKQIKTFYTDGSYKTLKWREIHIKILSTFKGRRKNVEVGNILLIEHPKNTGLDGRLSLHFIEVYDMYKGKGYGSSALDLTILLAQRLAKQSSFYDRLTLQCADYDGDTYLGNLPHRLSYYLNHGFHIDREATNYMRHLDPAYFVRHMEIDEFTTFLGDYDSGKYDTVSLPLKSYKDKATEILEILKQRHPLNLEEIDAKCLVIAESSSSDAGERILARLHYDAFIDDYTYDKRCLFSIYLMHLDVLHWGESIKQRQILKSLRDPNSTQTYPQKELDMLLLEISHINSTLINSDEETQDQKGLKRKFEDISESNDSSDPKTDSMDEDKEISDEPRAKKARLILTVTKTAGLKITFTPQIIEARSCETANSDTTGSN